MQARIWASGAIFWASLLANPSLAGQSLLNTTNSSSLLGFDVNFKGCREMISIKEVSAEKAREFIPSTYQLLVQGDDGNASVVVRVVDCDSVTVADSSPSHEIIAEIGVNIVAPDGTGDINNYTLWYETTSANLAARFNAVGVPAQLVPGIHFDYMPNSSGSSGNLVVFAPRPAKPSFEVRGLVSEPTNPPIQYTLNWWRSSSNEQVKMETTIPMIQFGSADLTLTTKSENNLRKLIGDQKTQSPGSGNFNYFLTAYMRVQVVPH